MLDLLQSRVPTNINNDTPLEDIVTEIPFNNDIRFEVSTKCNYKCVICPHHKLIRNKEIMPLETFKVIFDKVMAETNQFTNCTFPGMGEPTLDKTLLDKMRYVKEKRPDMSLTFITNASALTPEYWMKLEEIGVNSARISYYGNSAESYAKIMGTPNNQMFDRVTENLKKICKLKKKTRLLLTMNVVNEEFDVVTKDWIKFWEDEGIDLIEVWAPHNWVDAVKFRKVQDIKLNTCGRPFIGPLQIQVDGTVNMCCFDYDGHLTFGSLLTQSLKEIFSTPFFKKIVKAHATGNFAGTGLICENCDQRNADKSDIMVYNSKMDKNERVKQLSTTYAQVHE